MTHKARKKIAIDVDDVVAKTSEAVRIWANKEARATLQPEDYFIATNSYWNYYEAVWELHRIEGLSFGDFLNDMDVDQSHIAPFKGAKKVITQLKKEYDVVFITARHPSHKDGTRTWLDEHIDADTPLLLSYNPFANEAARSKGEICAELGVDVLIDDNIDNCQSAVDYGVEAITFGAYGWNMELPAGVQRCATWRDVEVYFGNRT